MVAFETSPTDEELRSFADPQGTPPYVRLDDDGTTLTARPKPFPMWFIWLWILVPAAGGYAGLVWEWSRNNDPLFRGLAIFIAVVWIPATVIACRLGMGGVIRAQVRQGDFFALDRAAGTLTLPRAGLTLRRGDVVELVEVHGWNRTRDGDGRSAEYIRELSVLARGPDGTLARYPVVAAGHAKPVRRVAAELSEFLGAPRRRLVEGVFFGGWRREA